MCVQESGINESSCDLHSLGAELVRPNVKRSDRIGTRKPRFGDGHSCKRQSRVPLVNPVALKHDICVEKWSGATHGERSEVVQL